jgi:hypothetical protein
MSEFSAPTSVAAAPGSGAGCWSWRMSSHSTAAPIPPTTSPTAMLCRRGPGPHVGRGRRSVHRVKDPTGERGGADPGDSSAAGPVSPALAGSGARQGLTRCGCRSKRDRPAGLPRTGVVDGMAALESAMTTELFGVPITATSIPLIDEAGVSRWDDLRARRRLCGDAEDRDGGLPPTGPPRAAPPHSSRKGTHDDVRPRRRAR